MHGWVSWSLLDYRQLAHIVLRMLPYQRQRWRNEGRVLGVDDTEPIPKIVSLSPVQTLRLLGYTLRRVRLVSGQPEDLLSGSVGLASWRPGQAMDIADETQGSEELPPYCLHNRKWWCNF